MNEATKAATITMMQIHAMSGVVYGLIQTLKASGVLSQHQIGFLHDFFMSNMENLDAAPDEALAAYRDMIAHLLGKGSAPPAFQVIKGGLDPSPPER